MTKQPSVIVRFAPSPTGRLHIGNIRPALFNYIFAQKNEGHFILRLDDTDQQRSTQDFADGIVEDLAWLGIEHDSFARQSERTDIYDAAADSLKQSGLLYPCYETPDEIERRRKRALARGLPPVYDRAALRLTEEEKQAFEAEGRKPHWRFKLPNFDENPFETRRTEVRFEDVFRGEQIVDLASMSDPVLIRGDGSYLYTLPSVVDDAEMGVTHVLRGGDHIANTGAQIALFEALNAKPPIFGHHNLLTDAKGEGLSKRSGSLSIKALREDGLESMAVASLAALVGTGVAVQPCASMDVLAAVFDPDTVSKSPAKFDEAELVTLNEKLLHDMSYDDAKPRLAEQSVDYGDSFWHAVRPNLTRMCDVMAWAKVLDDDFVSPQPEADDAEYLETAARLLPAEPWSDTIWKDWTNALKAETGRKGRGLFMPLRLALTGQSHGPDLADFLPVIGFERARKRLS